MAPPGDASGGQVASALRVPYSRVGDWERGRHIIGTVDLSRLLRVLGCELGDVIPEGD